jgi:hypothetical protein
MSLVAKGKGLGIMESYREKGGKSEGLPLALP